MLQFRRFSLLQKLAQAAAMTGAEQKAKLQEADAIFQGHFDPKQQDELRRKYNSMTSEAKQRIDIVVSHMMRLTQPERFVFGEELRQAKLKEFGLKDTVGLGWTPLVRKAAEKPKATGQGLEQFGLKGFPAETVMKLLKGEFTGKIVTEEPKAAEKPAEEAPKEEEKAAFDIYLTGFKTETKVALIKVVKDLMKLGLKESKDKVEEALKAPTLLFKTLPKDKVKDVQAKVEAAGGSLEIK